MKLSHLGAAFLVLMLRTLSGSSSPEAFETRPECSTVSGLVSACSEFVMYGYPDPSPDSPCCDAMGSLDDHVIAGSTSNRRLVCLCFMDLVESFSHNATAIATLPGLCGVSLGFTIDPTTDCDL